MARIERLRVFPVKGFDGLDREAVAVRDSGTLAHDREFAFVDADGEVYNGKRTDQIHKLRTDFDPATNRFTVERPGGTRETFDLATDPDRAAARIGGFLGADLRLRRDEQTGFVDRDSMGPSVVSTATLETVASWFEGLDVEGARRRLRANVEIAGVPAFWEDRFVGDGAPSFEAGGVRFEGVTPCGRCVVPRRDPDTGEPVPAFRERFVEKRRQTFPDWADDDAFDHYYSVMLITRVSAADRGKTLRAGDPVEASD